MILHVDVYINHKHRRLDAYKFVDVSKHNVQEIIREGIELVQNS